MAAGSPAEVVRSLLRTRTTVLADVDRGDALTERLLVRSDLSGTMQLYERSDGELIQITALPEPVATASYVPGSRCAVLAIDAGGNERHQLYLVDLDAAATDPVAAFERLQPLTSEPRFAHELAAIAPDGRWIAYLSDRANGVDFDLWKCNLHTGEHQLVYASGAYSQPASGCSPDGRFVSVLKPGDRPLDVELVLVEIDSGEALTPLPHPDEAAEVGEPAWTGPTSFCASSNVGRDFAAIVRHDLASGATVTVTGTGERFDADAVSSEDGSSIVVIENRGGAHAMWRYDPAGDGAGTAVPFPEPGIVQYFSFFAKPVLSTDGRRLHYTLTTPRLGGDVFSYEFASGRTERLTQSPMEVDPETLVSPELREVRSFDGELIPFFVFRPREVEAAAPVVVMIHGGPEAQGMLGFDPMIQALVTLGYGVVVPNVRGSTGYGKRYASLDDTTKRLDSVRDLEALHGALERNGFDSRRAALWGGSYGGYMVLAGLTFQPHLWAAGVDIVGVSSLVTFLENTSDYRRAFRELEYGSLEHDREFLTHASPLTHIDAIRAPLFVIHGRNDPRVPVGEAEQLADRLRSRGVRCELAIYEDEGHGLARLENQLDAYPRAIAFLDEILRRSGPAASCSPISSRRRSGEP